MHVLRSLLRRVIGICRFRGRYLLADRLGALLGAGAVEHVTRGGVHMALHQDQLLHRLIYHGLYEENVAAYMRRNLRPGEVVIDPGANIGCFAAVALEAVGATGHVYSLEPSRTAFAALRTANPDPPANWTVMQAAITDRSGRMTFNDTPRVISRGFACLEGVYAPKDAMPHPVDAFSLDDLCAQWGVEHVALLKLDIEGSELNALRGASGLLAAQRIRAILVETTVDADKRPVATAVHDLLVRAGYTPHRIRMNGTLAPVDILGSGDLREDILWDLPGAGAAVTSGRPASA